MAARINIYLVMALSLSIGLVSCGPEKQKSSQVSGKTEVSSRVDTKEAAKEKITKQAAKNKTKKKRSSKKSAEKKSSSSKYCLDQYSEKKFAKATNCFEEILEKDRSNWQAYNYISLAKAETNELDNCLEWIDRGLRYTQNSQLFQTRALCYFLGNDYKNAIMNGEKAISKDRKHPNIVDTYGIMAMSYFANQDVQKGYTFAKKFVDSDQEGLLGLREEMEKYVRVAQEKPAIKTLVGKVYEVKTRTWAGGKVENYVILDVDFNLYEIRWVPKSDFKFRKGSKIGVRVIERVLTPSIKRFDTASKKIPVYEYISLQKI
jgi:tetratricopeptide (TPR) repeat protein